MWLRWAQILQGTGRIARLVTIGSNGNTAPKCVAATTNRTPKPRTPLAITSALSTATSNALTVRLVATRKAAIHLLGYDAVGVGYGFGDLLKSPPESIPPERVFPFAAGTLPLGGEKAEEKFDNIAIQFAVGMRERLALSGQGSTTDDGLDFGIQLNLEAEARRQLGQRRFEINEQTNKIRLQPKNKLKESPDHFDALLIGYFALCMALRRSNFPWAMHFCRFPRK